MTRYSATITPELGSDIYPGAKVSVGLVGKETADRPWRPVSGYYGTVTSVSGFATYEVPASGTLVVDLYANADLTPTNTGWQVKAGGVNRRVLGVHEMPAANSALSASTLIDVPLPLSDASLVRGEEIDGIPVSRDVLATREAPEILDTRRSIWVPGSRMIATSGTPTQTSSQTWLLPPAVVSQVSAQVAVPGPVDVRIVYRAVGVPHGTNLLTPNQQTVETNTTGFSAGTGSTIARSTAQFRTGVASLSFTRTASSGQPRARTSTGLSGTAVTAGTSYVGQCWVKSGSTGTATVLIEFYDAAGASLGTTTGSSSVVTTSGWALVGVTATAPALSAFCSIQVSGSSVPNGELWYADDWTLAAANQPVRWTARALHLSWSEGSTATSAGNSGTELVPLLAPISGLTYHDVIASGLDIDPPQQVTISRIGTNSDDLFDGSIELVGCWVTPARCLPIVEDETRYLGLAGGILELPDGRRMLVTREGQGHSEEGPIVGAWVDDAFVCDWDGRWEIADAVDVDPDPEVVAFRSGTALMMDDSRVAILVERADVNHSTYGTGFLWCDDWANADDPAKWSYELCDTGDPGGDFRFWFQLHRLGEVGDGSWVAFGQDRSTADVSVMTTTTNGGTAGTGWTVTHGVVPAEDIDSGFVGAQDGPSEIAMCRISGTDRFVGVIRRNDINTQSAYGLATDDPTDPSAWRVQDAVTPMGQQPCFVWQEPISGLLHWWVLQRGAASIECQSNGIAERTGTPDDVWANPGSGWSTRWRRLYRAKNEMLGYICGVMVDRLGQIWGTFTDDEFPDADPAHARLTRVKVWPWDE